MQLTAEDFQQKQTRMEIPRSINHLVGSEAWSRARCSSQNNLVRCLGETPSAEFKSQYIRSQTLESLCLLHHCGCWQRWEKKLASIPGDAGDPRCGAAHIPWARRLLVHTTTFSYRFCFLWRPLLTPNGFGWKAEDFIACFDKEEIQCLQILSLHPPSQGRRSLFLQVKIEGILQWNRHNEN